MSRMFLAVACLTAVLFATRPAAGQIPDPDERLEMSSEAFLALARRPPVLHSWARMSGTVEHYAERKRSTFPIDLRIQMMPDVISGQIQLDGDERYAVTQNFADGRQGTVVLTQREASEGHVALRDLGLRPTDLTLSFLYWDYVEELERDSVKTQTCRVYRLREPESGEIATVWISVNALFPIRVKWQLADNQPAYRQLDFTDFVKRHGIWVVNGLRLKNPVGNKRWKTDVQFSEVEVQPIDAENRPPADLWIRD